MRAQDKSLKVGVYGGYFKDSFDKHIFPGFTEATGIAVESIAEPTGEAWLVQLQQAAQANVAPADVSMMSQVATLKGMAVDLWAPLDLAKMPNAANVKPEFVNKYADGRVAGIGAVTWYITLVSNTNAYPTAPDSWAFLWDPSNADKLGLLALVSNSFLLEITSKTFFGGDTKKLDTDEGILRGDEQDRRAEAEREALVSRRGAVRAGAEIGRDPDGPVLSRRDRPRRRRRASGALHLPEGRRRQRRRLVGRLEGVRRSSTRRMPSSTSCRRPEIQALLSRKVGTSPTVKREVLDLTDEEFAAVSSDIPPIIPRYDLYQTKSDWLNQKWTELIVAG